MPDSVSGGDKVSLASRAGGMVVLAPLLLILALLGFQVLSGYQTARREAQTTVDNLADVLTLTVKSALERLSSDLDSFAADIPMAELNATIPPARRQMLEQRMNAVVQGFDAVLAFRVFDRAGNVILAAGSANPQARFNVADREWFKVLNADKTRSFFITEVLISKATGQPGFFFIRPIRDADGTFLGAVNAHFNLGWFQTVIDKLSIGDEGLVTLRHRDGARLLARRPLVSSEINESNSGLYRLHVSTLETARGEFVSAIDHIRRIYAFRGLAPYPLTVVVAISPADFLKPWKIQASLTTVVALLLSIIQIVVFRRLDRAYQASRTLAAQLQASNTELQRSNAELEEFAYIASHDLQTPLRNIVCFSQLLLKRFSHRLDKEGEEFLDFIVVNAQRMSCLIRDLLVYARVTRPDQIPEPVAAQSALKQVLDDLAPAIAEAGAEIEIGPLPMVLINPNQLGSLFLNLFSNALKYRSPDRSLVITVSAQPHQDGLWHFCVADNGIGIEPAYWEKIFAIFQRLHTQEKYEGDGIGLALCRRIVRRAGGTIWVSSEPGRGSSFHFTLPGA